MKFNAFNSRPKEYALCQCGAITLYYSDGTNYSCKKVNFNTFFPDVDLDDLEQLQTTYCCDHCVNHYGLDLCGCGCGEDFGHCATNLIEGLLPMQMFGKYRRIVANDALIKGE